MLKGVDVLLRAAVRLDRNGVESTGYVIGNGEDARELDQLRRTLGVSDSVIFTGYRPDARSILGELDVFVIPSRHEGLPVALLEAMALEKPIVSTMVGGIPEVLEHERSALLVPPDDPDAMADAIARLLTDTELAMCLGREAGCVARDRFGARIAADRLLEGYGELLGSGFPLMTSS
jgi:glycosyltransferase involved in cell wall biosynthesis